eukprot:5173069-Prymnesium_polylepis.1
MAYNPTLITYALPSPPPGRSPSAPMPRVDRYGIVVDASKRSAPGFAVSGDGRGRSGSSQAIASRTLTGRGWVGAHL